MEVTEKWLGEIGGWAAMKSARGLVHAGMATVQSSAEGLIRGLAGGGKTKFACGLRIRSKSDVDNLCTCPTSRRGVICEHSLAVALAWINGPQKTTASSAPSLSNSAGPAAGSAAGRPSTAPILELKKVPGRYSIFLPETLLRGAVREPVPAYVRFEPGGAGEESRLAAWLAAQGVEAQSAPLSLRGQSWSELLIAAGEHPRVFAGKPSGGGEKLEVAAQPVALPLVIAEGAGEEVSVALDGGDQRALDGAGHWWICLQTHTIFRSPPASRETGRLLADLAGGGEARRTLRWLVQERAALGDVFQVRLAGTTLEAFHVVPVPTDIEVIVDGSLNAVQVELWASFDACRWPLTGTVSETLFPIQDQSRTGTFYVRNMHVESRFLAEFSALGFKSSGPRPGREGEVLTLAQPDAVLAFYATDLPRLKQRCRVVESDRWKAATRGVARIVPRVREEPSTGTAVGGGSDWLTMEFGYQAADGFSLSRAEVLRLVRSGKRSVSDQRGKRYVLDLASVEEFEETLRDIPLELTPDGARVHALHAPYLLPSETAEGPELPPESEFLAAVGPLGARLRPYQLLGARWLQAQVSAGRGGVLGDDMGLGKTIQSIALVCALQGAAPGTGGPVLVVCPKSLVGNWLAEFERFAPALRVAAVRGDRRAEVLETISAYQVIITTYQLIIRDIEVHRKQRWGLILLDEASYIRNPDTEAAKALRQLQSPARLALTGTPVENSTRDLWSIYQFVLPGYLGSRETFKERFEQPIQNGLNTPAGLAASDRLKKLIRPYFLRRTKREVLKDLPEKIEQILWCEPSSAQAEVYRRLLEEGREEIRAARKRSGQSGAKMTMFTVLLRLRQACCDLRLTGLQQAALEGLAEDDFSGKWPMLRERLETILESGGKVLIFSQFVKFLHLVRDFISAEKVAFSYLDGSTQDRDVQVQKFQTEPDRRAFLISLKAGGYGLNLTAADHVILLDPWWNPAVEAQAIDRAHRIGQQRVVTAFRLAMRGTVEERILALQAKKRGFIEAAVEEDSPLMAGLQTGDLEALIES